jgi:hypothetical protein
MGRLVAEHLQHLDREETLANRALWAHRTDEQLQEMEGRIVGPIPPERLAEWLEVMLPVMNRAERSELIGGLHAGLPAAAFRAVTTPARLALGAVAWERALISAGVTPSDSARGATEGVLS